MSVPQKERKSHETQPLRPSCRSTLPPAPPRRKMPCLNEWDFWRFLLSALGLLWDILKSTFLK